MTSCAPPDIHQRCMSLAIFALGGPSTNLWATLWLPAIHRDGLIDYGALVAAILGSTISPYLLYFYSSGTREEGWSARSLPLNRVTAYVGMGFGAVGALALIILSGMVLQPRHSNGGQLGDIGLPLSHAFGKVGLALFAITLFATCLGAAFEVVLGLTYLIAQGFGWEWGENKRPVQAARFNLTIIVFLCIAVLLGSFGLSPLQLALVASMVIALLLPFSLSPFLILMNAPAYLGKYTNRRWQNVAMIAVLAMAFLVALASLPLVILSGGG